MTRYRNAKHSRFKVKFTHISFKYKHVNIFFTVTLYGEIQCCDHIKGYNFMFVYHLCGDAPIIFQVENWMSSKLGSCYISYRKYLTTTNTRTSQNFDTQTMFATGFLKCELREKNIRPMRCFMYKNEQVGRVSPDHCSVTSNGLFRTNLVIIELISTPFLSNYWYLKVNCLGTESLPSYINSLRWISIMKYRELTVVCRSVKLQSHLYKG